MKNDISDDADSAFEKLQIMIDDDKFHVFTKEEAKALREVATIWSQIKSFVVVGSAIGAALRWFVLLLAAWAAFKLGFIEWVQSAIKS